MNERKEKLDEWHINWKSTNEKWNFNKELFEYLETDVKILMCVMKFRKLFKDFWNQH